jgi:hypothetical protein
MTSIGNNLWPYPLKGINILIIEVFYVFIIFHGYKSITKYEFFLKFEIMNSIYLI